MSNQEIMLAVTYDEDKVQFPVEVSIKLDGVAADFYRTPNGWVAQSRQGEPLPSVAHICTILDINPWPGIGTHIVGELTVVGEPVFKNASGIIRRDKVDSRIVLNVYDMYYPERTMVYEDRVTLMDALFLNHMILEDGNLSYEVVRRVPVCGVCTTHAELEEHFNSIEQMMKPSPLFEGFMVRCLKGKDSYFNRAKRSRNMMRYKPKPTVDLKVIAFEEATANKTMSFLGDEYKKGDGLKAVGRIVCLYGGKEIGVGPGTLKHTERREIWERYQALLARGESLNDKRLIAEVEYMLDDSYAALRQPVFKQWRPDKKEASEQA